MVASESRSGAYVRASCETFVGATDGLVIGSAGLVKSVWHLVAWTVMPGT